MTAHEFIKQNIGNKVYVSGERDLAFNGELRKIIFNKTELTIVKLTRGGMAHLVDSDNKFYTVPPSNVNLI
jgi:hypothetical protein